MLEKPYIEDLALAIPKSNNYYTTEKQEMISNDWMKIALGGVIFVPNLNMHKRPIGRFMESPIPLEKMMENESSVARVKIRFFSG